MGILDVPVLGDLEEHALADGVLRHEPIEGPLRGAALEQDARVKATQVGEPTIKLPSLRSADTDGDALAATGEKMHAIDIAVT